ncbi:hypothetical protein HZB97_03315, partial [Candidatus Gottesmanbacteria bacterium]|nr:hypothetical protein [Candidatus Gottesmanbacteria bacterium]
MVLNKEICKPYERKIIDDKKNEFTFEFVGGKAWGWWGYQLSGLNKSYYGFHTFRRGRLVTTYDKIGLTPNQDIKQIVGDLYEDNSTGLSIGHSFNSHMDNAQKIKNASANGGYDSVCY